MDRVEIQWTDHFADVMGAMRKWGLLLGSYDGAGRANAMTIGWGSLGSIWSMPMWIVLVRPSRYTYECIEHSGCFTVNVPGPNLDKACAVCGSRSGRDGDKLADAGVTAEKAVSIEAPTLAQCPIVYECTVVHRNDIIPEKLVQELRDGPYANGDYHRVYFGRIVTARAAAAAAAILGG